MNILMIAGRLPFHPLDGGTARVYHLVKEWSKRHNITLVVPMFTPVAPDAISRCAEEIGVELHAVPVQLAPKVRRVADYTLRMIRGLPIVDYYPEMLSFVHNLVRVRKFDLIEFEGSGGGTFFSALSDLPYRPRTVLVFYDVMWQWWKREYIASRNLVSLARWLSYRIWEPHFVRQADCCVFLSEVDAQTVSSVVKPNQTLVVPLGIQTTAFDKTPLPDEPEVLFVGSFNHLPNIQAVKWLITEIWPVLKKRIPLAHLTIIGRNPSDEIIKLAKSARVSLFADVPDVQPYYKQARVVIVPIKTGGGIRMKILEAFAAARPIVTTQIGAEGLPIVPNEHALFANSVEEIIEALSRVLTDRQFAERLAVNGRALVEREFDWPIIASKLQKTFYPE